jgi:Ion channel
MRRHELRRKFLGGLLAGLRVVWPILSGLLLLIVGLGVVIGLLEHWSLQESVYFAFVSGLTIGYGDLAPKLLITRALAIGIGFCGVLFTALVAAVAVRALSGTVDLDAE